jgi:hypothetical protein
VCAASSTPIAATMILKGLSPGAALVFLLAGPATNLATLTVMTKYLGKRVVMVHVAVLAIVTLGFGFATNLIYDALGREATVNLPTDHEHGASPWTLAAAALFGVLMLTSFWRQFSQAEDGEECSDHEH